MNGSWRDRLVIDAIIGAVVFIAIVPLAGLGVGLVVGGIVALMAYEFHSPSDPNGPLP